MPIIANIFTQGPNAKALMDDIQKLTQGIYAANPLISSFELKRQLAKALAERGERKVLQTAYGRIRTRI